MRDLLLGQVPRDWDICIARNKLHTAKALLRSAKRRGGRFPLLFVKTPAGPVEVLERKGPLHRDALERDLTVNALYADSRCTFFDPLGTGFADLGTARARVIGEPEVRFRKDPTRIVRLARIAGKLGLLVDEQTRAAARNERGLLSKHRAKLELRRWSALTPEQLKAAREILSSCGRAYKTRWLHNGVLTFGKYRGKQLAQVPRSYLVWILRSEFPPDLHTAVRRQLQKTR